MLSTVDGLTVVADAPDGRTAVAQVQELRPDGVLMDLHMPVMGGIEATAAIFEDDDHVAILALTMLEDNDAILGAMAAGAFGYLLEGAEPAPTPSTEQFPALTAREVEVLDLLASG